MDSLYASNAIGENGMGMVAMGMFAPFNHFLYAASMMLVSGFQILYGRYISKDHAHVRSVFTVDLMISAAGALLVAVLMALGAVCGWTRVFTSHEKILDMFNSYLLGQSIGIVPLILGQQLFSFLSLENQTKRTMAASIACVLTNIALDHALIVFLNMGTFGLGLASSISCWIFLAIQAVYYLTGKSEWKFSLKNCIWKGRPGDFHAGVFRRAFQVCGDVPLLYRQFPAANLCGRRRACRLCRVQSSMRKY